MAAVRRLSPRAEKTIRLVASCSIAILFGAAAVVRDSETLGYIGVAVMLAGILAGPFTSRLLTREVDR
jgi:hypothetical protein